MDSGGKLVRSEGPLVWRFHWSRLRYELARKVGYAYWSNDGTVAGGFSKWEWEKQQAALKQPPSAP